MDNCVQPTQLMNARSAILWAGRINSMTKVQTTTRVPPMQRPNNRREAKRNCQFGENAKLIKLNLFNNVFNNEETCPMPGWPTLRRIKQQEKLAYDQRHRKECQN
jgi:hypothetical protein